MKSHKTCLTNHTQSVSNHITPLVINTPLGGYTDTQTTHIHTDNTHTHADTHKYTHTQTHTLIQIHTQTHTHTHVHIHTYAPMHEPKQFHEIRCAPILNIEWSYAELNPYCTTE